MRWERGGSEGVCVINAGRDYWWLFVIHGWPFYLRWDAPLAMNHLAFVITTRVVLRLGTCETGGWTGAWVHVQEGVTAEVKSTGPSS